MKVFKLSLTFHTILLPGTKHSYLSTTRRQSGRVPDNTLRRPQIKNINNEQVRSENNARLFRRYGCLLSSRYCYFKTDSQCCYYLMFSGNSDRWSFLCEKTATLPIVLPVVLYSLKMAPADLFLISRIKTAIKGFYFGGIEVNQTALNQVSIASF